MTEAPESRTEPKANTLSRVAAWVGIVAAIVFIVAVIFFSGFYIGRQAGGWYHDGYRVHHHPGEMMGPGQMGPGGMMGLWPWLAPDYGRPDCADNASSVAEVTADYACGHSTFAFVSPHVAW